MELPAGTYGANGEVIKDLISLSFKTEAFVPPVVKLASDLSELKENSDTAVISAYLDKTTENEVIVALSFGGTSPLDSDYSVSSQSIVISSGSLSGSLS